MLSIAAVERRATISRLSEIGAPEYGAFIEAIRARKTLPQTGENT
jgi:hypothetical protein